MNTRRTVGCAVFVVCLLTTSGRTFAAPDFVPVAKNGQPVFCCEKPCTNMICTLMKFLFGAQPLSYEDCEGASGDTVVLNVSVENKEPGTQPHSARVRADFTTKWGGASGWKTVKLAGNESMMKAFDVPEECLNDLENCEFTVEVEPKNAKVIDTNPANDSKVGRAVCREMNDYLIVEPSPGSCCRVKSPSDSCATSPSDDGELLRIIVRNDGFSNVERDGFLWVLFEMPNATPAPQSYIYIWNLPGFASEQLPYIAKGTERTYHVPIPDACYVGGKCSFSVVANALNLVPEWNMRNNGAEGVCEHGEID